MKIQTLIIFTLGFATGVSADQALTKHIETAVAERLDDRATLQNAGYFIDGMEGN